MKEREHLTREQAIEFCKDKIRLHEMARNEIVRKFDIIEDKIAMIKYSTHVDRINAYTDIVELLSQ